MTLAAVPPTRGNHAPAADEAAGPTAEEVTAANERRGSLGKITTRPSVTEDSAFMLELYASTSKEVLDDLGWSIGGNRTFVIMQAQTEEWNRARQYPGMDRLTICVDEMPVGRLLVSLRNNILHLVDLSLLPRFRGLGIGTQLMGEILGEARNARVPVKVRVLKNSGSVRFAERLGFATPTDLGQYVELTWMPPLTALGPDAREEGFSSNGTRANRVATESTLDDTVDDVDGVEGVDAPDYADFAPIEPIDPAPAFDRVTPTPDVELPAAVEELPAEVVQPTEVAEVTEVAAVAGVAPVAEVAEVAEVADVVELAGAAAAVEPVEFISEASEVNEAVLAYVADADAEYLAEPVWLAPEVVVEDTPVVEEVDEEAVEEPVVETDPEVAARNAEYLEAVTATDAFTSSLAASFSAEVAEEDDPDDVDNLPVGADRYDPFS
jgi:GNAT superfamily N-acetyltransferase